MTCDKCKGETVQVLYSKMYLYDLCRCCGHRKLLKWPCADGDGGD
jgi:hypothetical protein